ncbi:hypothetical protein GN244_ATG20318 [Phytophthora infestans]|uniref:glucan endo-1,3-beta-D-glucosidase n=1 Tax=Phytophthora infestans TaxID=4787 RepID=A0A833VTL8_PHYIN|nr:hypothetical protein GN244_ATG20318 [Phytophthora infestans]
MAVLATDAVDATLPGVCFAPWHHDTVTSDVLATDMAQIAEYFTAFRSFRRNTAVLTSLRRRPTQVSKWPWVYVQLTDSSAIASEIQAVCDGYSSYPDAIEAVDLVSGDYGSFSADTLTGYISQVKECTSNAVPVGSVQRINEWLNADDASTLAAACDVIGVNIYPFFTQGDSTSVSKLETQWAQMLAAGYDESTMHVTETGWPYEGDDYEGNSPSYDGMQQYLDDWATWSSSVQSSYWFMMYDTTTSYTGANYETHFGIFGDDMVAHVIRAAILTPPRRQRPLPLARTPRSRQRRARHRPRKTQLSRLPRARPRMIQRKTSYADDSATEEATSAPTTTTSGDTLASEEEDTTVATTDSPAVTPAVTTATTTTANCAM